MENKIAAPAAQGYSRRILREVKVWDVIVLGIVPAIVQPVIAHKLSPSEGWESNVVAAVIAYGAFFVGYCLYRITQATIKLLRENSEEIKALREFRAANSERKIFFFSPGVAVSLNRSAVSVVVNLHILSTERTELSYIRLHVTDSTGLRIACEYNEPLIVNRFEITAKSFEQKITPQELEKFQKGMQINLDGYAKFRDGSEITQERISLSTIPNV